MYCARCGRTFGKYEMRTYTVLPGRSNQKVPTCYHDRLCYSKRKATAVVVTLVVAGVDFSRKSKDNARGLAKYLRKYKFKGR